MTTQEKFEEIMLHTAFPNNPDVHDRLLSVMRQCYNLALQDASEAAKLNYHEGITKVNMSITYFQSGSDNIQVDKQSILNLKIEI